MLETALPWAQEAKILAFGVVPGYLRQGIGLALQQAAIAVTAVVDRNGMVGGGGWL